MSGAQYLDLPGRTRMRQTWRSTSASTTLSSTHCLRPPSKLVNLPCRTRSRLPLHPQITCHQVASSNVRVAESNEMMFIIRLVVGMRSPRRRQRVFLSRARSRLLVGQLVGPKPHRPRLNHLLRAVLTGSLLWWARLPACRRFRRSPKKRSQTSVWAASPPTPR